MVGHSFQYFFDRFVQGKYINIGELERYLNRKNVRRQEKAHGLILLGHLQAAKERYSEAREAYEEAMELHPSYRDEVKVKLAEVSVFSGIKEGMKQLQKLKPERMSRHDQWSYWDTFLGLAEFSWDDALIKKVISQIPRKLRRDPMMSGHLVWATGFLKFIRTTRKNDGNRKLGTVAYFLPCERSKPPMGKKGTGEKRRGKGQTIASGRRENRTGNACPPSCRESVFPFRAARQAYDRSLRFAASITGPTGFKARHGNDER